MHLDHAHTHDGPSAVSADAHRPDGTRRALRIGLGGPVGSGKTATVAALCRALRDAFSLAVVTNDIYTREDAEFLLREAVLPPERITAVETGACPHTAIRDDISANLEAVEDLEDEVGPLDLVLVESGGDNLTATFSKGLVDAQIFVIDVAGGTTFRARAAPGSPPPTCSSSTRPTSRRTSAPIWGGWPPTPRRSAPNCPSSSSRSAPSPGSPPWPTGCGRGSPRGRHDRGRGAGDRADRGPGRRTRRYVAARTGG
uniref:CobW/HypB/UreG nucleotide-binding domain-containing protein n=1 Tax=Streptomyces avermitilis TaxID=33903 RepID=A0A499VM15_STRAX|nr:hypothetical protein SAVMC3_80530 [Streptomyces avermitilis]